MKPGDKKGRVTKLDPATAREVLNTMKGMTEEDLLILVECFEHYLKWLEGLLNI